MAAVLVTGVSSGIGCAVAERLAGRGHTVFGTVRNPADGARLQARLGNDFVPLVADVTDPATLAAAADHIATHPAGQTLGGLVNNAGIVVEALTSPNPRPRYAIGRSANVVAALAGALPTRLQDRLLARSLGLLPARHRP